MRIQVMAEHILKGEPRKRCTCAIALAIRDVVKQGMCVWVGGTITRIGANHQECEHAVPIRLPREAKAFIDRFDLRLPVEPFEFNLPIEQEWLPPVPVLPDGTTASDDDADEIFKSLHAGLDRLEKSLNDG